MASSDLASSKKSDGVFAVPEKCTLNNPPRGSGGGDNTAGSSPQSEQSAQGSDPGKESAAQQPPVAAAQAVSHESSVESFRVGYHECLSEIMHFLVEKEGMYPRDPLCSRLMSHIQAHYKKINRGESPEEDKE